MQKQPRTESPTRSERLLAALADRKWHATKELARRVGHSFGGAVFRLRAGGFGIRCEKHPAKRHQYRYRLVEQPPARSGVRRTP